MSELEKLKHPIRNDLSEFNNFFRSVMRTDNKLLNIILQYILRTKGKQLRPILVFYSSRLCSEPTELTYIAAALIELLHTATLVHDDVVDNSQLRRGFFSIKALWRSKVAVLVGDYLLSKGLLLSVQHKAYNLLEIVSEAVEQMAEGELLQIEKARTLDIKEELYYQIIKKKTAALIAASTSAGFSSVSNDYDKLLIIKDIGLNLGMAFQIKDDLFDYENRQSVIGKPIGNDLQEKKITLPLIYALNNSSTKERRNVLKMLSSSDIDGKVIDFIIDFVKHKGGVDYAYNRMLAYIDEAKKLLDENFSSSEISEYFKKLMLFIVKRKK